MNFHDRSTETYSFYVNICMLTTDTQWLLYRQDGTRAASAPVPSRVDGTRADGARLPSRRYPSRRRLGAFLTSKRR